MTGSDEELRQAVRALLAEPLASKGSPALSGVRRHRKELARWFTEELGYRLDATRPGVARLAKLPGAGHQPRGLSTRAGRPFDGRRYALTCLVLASSESAGEHTTLARLFEDVSERASAVEGLEWDSGRGADRRVFIQAVQAAVDLGVLEKAEGDEERFARGEAGGDALYRIDRDRLAMLPTAPQPPSLAPSPDEVAREAYPDTEDGRARRRRHRITRALVEQPVVYHDDLAPDELDYLRSQRARLERVLSEKVGLTLEVRAEGWVAVDEAGTLTDLRWPDYGAAETTALRLCDELRSRQRRRDPPRWASAEVTTFVQGLAAEYAGYWKQGTDSTAGAQLLVDEAVGILVAARLVRRYPDGIEARPGTGRYAASAPLRPPPVPLELPTPEGP
ncbi:MAG: TIGR02678 family protein [Actinomycetota bacterium]|nr:TIGR02678 family protein [Actinomycetota bacterium]